MAAIVLQLQTKQLRKRPSGPQRFSVTLWPSTEQVGPHLYTTYFFQVRWVLTYFLSKTKRKRKEKEEDKKDGLCRMPVFLEIWSSGMCYKKGAYVTSPQLRPWAQSVYWDYLTRSISGVLAPLVAGRAKCIQRDSIEKGLVEAWASFPLNFTTWVCSFFAFCWICFIGFCCVNGSHENDNMLSPVRLPCKSLNLELAWGTPDTVG